MSLHHPEVEGRAGLGHGTLSLGGVALGPAGAHPHLLHARELRRTSGHLNGAGETYEREGKRVNIPGVL